MTDPDKHDQIFDVLIIGGGINGAGIACDAAARGLQTVLLESHDIASGTSSRSSKLVHGGLRYLAYYDFRLVRESLSERERLLKKARHISWPLRFVMPVTPNGRPAWLVRIGLFLYDHLASRQQLPGTESVRLNDQPERMGFLPKYSKAFIYSDCWVDDARLVVANLQGAQENGAKILARTQFESAERKADGWDVNAVDLRSGQRRTIRARIVVNAAGPWAGNIAESQPDVSVDYSAQLVRGSHIIVPKLYSGPHATMLQLSDGRIIVTMPYETDYTLVGTTDQVYEGDPRAVEITSQERDYLIEAVNEFFSRQISVDDIVWAYAGVRPLFEEGKSRDTNPTTITRDYSFKTDCGPDGTGAPFLTILGGKLTTYRRLAEAALRELNPFLPANAHVSKSAESLLPGADVGAEGPEVYASDLSRIYPWLSEKHCKRLARTYGSLTSKVLGDAQSLDDLGTLFGDDLYEREVDYLIAHEWAVTAEDVLWRRTKCGLRFTPAEIEALSEYMAAQASYTDEQELAS